LCLAELTDELDSKNESQWPVARCMNETCRHIIEIDDESDQNIGSVACAVVVEIQRISRNKYKKSPQVLWPIKVNNRPYSQNQRRPFR